MISLFGDSGGKKTDIAMIVEFIALNFWLLGESSYLTAVFIYLCSLLPRFNQNIAASVLGAGSPRRTQGPSQMV